MFGLCKKDQVTASTVLSKVCQNGEDLKMSQIFTSTWTSGALKREFNNRPPTSTLLTKSATCLNVAHRKHLLLAVALLRQALL